MTVMRVERVVYGDRAAAAPFPVLLAGEEIPALFNDAVSRFLTDLYAARGTLLG